MATKLYATMYVHAYFDKDGKFQTWHCCDWKMDSTPNVNGVFVFMHVADIELEIPYTEKDAIIAAASGLDAVIAQKKKEHADWMREVGFFRNRLLALPNPDVL